MAAAALLRLQLLPLVGEEVVHRTQNKGTKLASIGISVGKRLPHQQAREKRLREIFGVLRWIPAPTHISVERIPIRLTQALECGASAGCVAAPGPQDNGPPRRDKDGLAHDFNRRRHGGIAGVYCTGPQHNKPRIQSCSPTSFSTAWSSA